MDVRAKSTRKPWGGVGVKLALAVGFLVLFTCVLATIPLREGAEPSAASRDPQMIPASRLHLPELGGMVRIPAGRLLIDSSVGLGASDEPRRSVEVPSFWLDKTPVTNRAFARFVDATGYQTTAEARGHSLFFDRETGRWRRVEGADWQHPDGPDSSIAGQEDWPVVQVSWYDARAYARWAKKRLPTDGEYEYAARGGLVDCDYPWGRELLARGRHRANAWQGRFPHFDQARDGYLGRSPVHAFPANRYGLFDMVGNVYCWCADSHDRTRDARRSSVESSGYTPGDPRIQRGGSWLSAGNYEPLAVWQQRTTDPSESTNHVGFRCARDLPPEGSEELELASRPTGPTE